MTDFQLRQDCDAQVTDRFHSDADYVRRRQEIVRKLSASVKSAQGAFPLAAERTARPVKRGPLTPSPGGPPV